MKTILRQGGFALLLAAFVLPAGCATTLPEAAAVEPGPRVVSPGAPGEASRTITAAEAAAMPQPVHTAADVTFMQGMIEHHAQALRMTQMVQARTERQDIRLLALRIEVSQADEIRLMRQWLLKRGEDAPDPIAHAGHAGHAGHGADHSMMPGMLTEAEFVRLEAATGPEFERLFLELMIRHHAGAITMVEQLFATDGAGQESELYQFATDVDADQRMEIDRMRRMLAAGR
jgi:uncharacterized protein (DUF305 family)